MPRIKRHYKLFSKQMKLTMGSKALCRTALLGYDETLVSGWQELLLQIEMSSSNFYNLINNVDPSQPDQLDPKLRYSLWKYFSRAKYRATPFAGFGSFTIVPVGDEFRVPKVTVSKAIMNHQFVDWAEKDNVQRTSSKERKCLLLTNGTFYRVGPNIRFITTANSEFQIEEVSYSEILQAVLDYCVVKKSKDDLSQFLTQNFGHTVNSAKSVIRQLIKTQLLITQSTPNILGTDYFERIDVKNVNPIYTIAERKLVEGGIPSEKLKDISELISFLNKILPSSESRVFQKFKKEFLTKYETKEVQLLAVLDPEIGITYDANDKGDMLPVFINHTESDYPVEIKYTQLHKFLLNNISKSSIQIEQFNDNSFTQDLKIPNSLSALVSFSDDMIVVNSVGGHTANSLLGRFTLAGQEIEEMSKEIAGIEIRANPDVVFFDIGYFEETKVDNVNRRKLVYDFELPILSWPTKSGFLRLSDIYLSYSNGELVMFSKTLGKRIVPRVASSYNYHRSTLSIFRFLNDLQNQGIRTDLTFKLNSYFPGLDFYPRVLWKSIIISPTMWRVPDFFYKRNPSFFEKLQVLREWMTDNNIPRIFKCGHADQLLTFRRDSEDELHYFLKFIIDKREIYICESFQPDGTVRNCQDQILTHEFVFNFRHTNQLYKPVNHRYNIKEDDVEPAMLFNSKWIYYAIYLHPEQSNDLLFKVDKEIKRNFRGRLLGWFFVRYSDPKPHLRIRLQLKDAEDFSVLNNCLCNFLREDIKSGLISNFEMRTYFREVQRYSAVGVANAETQFMIDSKFVIQAMKQITDVVTLYSQIIFVYSGILSAFLDLENQIRHLSYFSDQLTTEGFFNSQSYKDINRLFKEMLTKTQDLLNNSNWSRQMSNYQLWTISILKKCDPAYILTTYNDFLHMHVNRLFPSKQNYHEAIIYNLLLKQRQYEMFLMKRDGN